MLYQANRCLACNGDSFLEMIYRDGHSNNNILYLQGLQVPTIDFENLGNYIQVLYVVSRSNLCCLFRACSYLIFFRGGWGLRAAWYIYLYEFLCCAGFQISKYPLFFVFSFGIVANLENPHSTKPNFSQLPVKIPPTICHEI